MKNIIFICTGNICRSPVAMYYMKKRIKELNKQKEYFIDSAGIYAVNGEKSTINAINNMKKYNINLDKHEAKHINKVNLNKYNLIICMSNQHKEHIVNKYNNLNNVYTLKEYVNPNIDYVNIDDPYGYGIEVYDNINKEIMYYINALIEKF